MLELRPLAGRTRGHVSYYVVKVYGLTCDGDGCEAVPLIDARNKLEQT